jgi:hypothetical protein
MGFLSISFCDKASRFLLETPTEFLYSGRIEMPTEITWKMRAVSMTAGTVFLAVTGPLIAGFGITTGLILLSLGKVASFVGGGGAAMETGFILLGDGVGGLVLTVTAVANPILLGMPIFALPKGYFSLISWTWMSL